MSKRTVKNSENNYTEDVDVVGELDVEIRKGQPKCYQWKWPRKIHKPTEIIHIHIYNNKHFT